MSETGKGYIPLNQRGGTPLSKGREPYTHQTPPTVAPKGPAASSAASPGFTPAAWMLAVADPFGRPVYRPFGIDPDNMINNYTRTDRKPAWLARRKRFAKEWKWMRLRGLKNEFLDRGFCSECGGELEITTDTDYLVATPNPDYVPPAPLVGNSVTIPRAREGSK